MVDLRNALVTPRMQVSLTIRRLAGGSYEDVRLWHGIVRPTFHAVFHRVIAVINEHPAVGALLWPTAEGCARNAQAFAARSGPTGRQCPLLLKAIGALDGIFYE